MAQENNLLDFNWEDDNETYFETAEEKAAKEAVVTPKAEEEESETPEQKAAKAAKVKKGEEEEEAEGDYFEVKKSKGSVESEEGSEEEDTEGNIYKDLYKDMKTTGLFKHVEIEEDEEIDADRFAELQEEEFEAEVSERIITWAGEMDDDAKAFIKFKKEGGNTSDFFAAYSKSSDLPSGDIEDEDYQDEVIRYQLSEEGWDKEEVEDRLEYLTTSGKKKAVAEKYDVKVKAEDTKRKQEMLAQAEKAKNAQRIQEDNFKADIKGALEEADEIEGFKISKQDKTDIFNFLTKKEHKISDTKSITNFQKKLAEIFQDTNKTILLAKLINSDFDMSGFEKKVITKKTREIKTNLEQRKGLRTFSSGSSLKGSGLADLFN